MAHQQPLRFQLERVDLILHDDLAVRRGQPLLQPDDQPLPGSVRRVHILEHRQQYMRPLPQFQVLPVLEQHYAVKLHRLLFL